MNLKKEIKEFEKDLGKEVKEIEKWMVERKKFFIKLGFVIGFVIVLLVISYLYLRISGVGV